MREAQSTNNADKLGNKRFAQNYTQIRAFLVAQKVKNPPEMRETWFQSQGWENPLEKGTATHSSILAWRIPMDRGTWQATVHRVAKSQTHLSD